MKLLLGYLFITIISITCAPIDVLDPLDRSDIVKEGVPPYKSEMELLQSNADDIADLEEKNLNSQVASYKYDRIGATVHKYREPEKGDTSSSVVTYTLHETPDFGAYINGFRRNTMLIDGTKAEAAGANVELKAGPNVISLGAEKPEESDGHYVLTFEGKARVLDSEDTHMDLRAKASRVVGGIDDAKTTLKFDLGLEQSLKV